jgi:hypothetical protein
MSTPYAPDNAWRGRLRAALGTTTGRVAFGLSQGLLFLVFMLIVPRLITGRGGSWLLGAIPHLPMAIGFVGFALLGRVLIRRGVIPRCAACEYDLSGPPEGGYDLCPECGARLRTTGAVVQGKRVIHRGLLTAGLVLAITPFLWFAVALRAPLTSMSWYLPFAPTGSLIAEVTAAPRGFTMEEWAELAKRTLTQAQSHRLARGLIDLRRQRGYSDPAAEGWLERYALAGAMAPDLRERYYSEMIDVWLAAPESASPGESVTAGLGAVFRGNISYPTNTSYGVKVIVEEFLVEDAPAAPADTAGLGASVDGVSLATMRNTFRGVTGDRRAHSTAGPAVTVHANRPGPMVVRARGWIYVAPVRSSTVPGGPVTLPAGTVWSRRLDVSDTIRIPQ